MDFAQDILDKKLCISFDPLFELSKALLPLKTEIIKKDHAILVRQS